MSIVKYHESHYVTVLDMYLGGAEILDMLKKKVKFIKSHFIEQKALEATLRNVKLAQDSFLVKVRKSLK